jgi:hypothetical protein
MMDLSRAAESIYQSITVDYQGFPQNITEKKHR